MPLCADLCREWVRETEDGPVPTEVGKDFGGRCFCCYEIVRYQVWRLRGSEHERRFLCNDCYVRSGLFVSWLGLAKSVADMGFYPRKVCCELGWTTLPGLRGLSVSEFRTAPTDAPDNERGVAVEFTSEAERDGLLRRLEEHFGTQRFSNGAAAFEAVKTYVLEWAARDL